MALTTQTAGHAHSIIMISAAAEGLAELKAGVTSYEDGHTHNWLMDDAGNIILTDAEGHTHGLSVLVKTDDTVEHISPAEDSPGITPSTDNIMTEKNDNAAAEAGAVQGQLDELTAKNERLSAIVSLSPEQRAHFDQLEGEAADDFLKAEDKDAVVKNAADENAVVYTAMNGDEFRKSDDPRLIKMAQERDDERRQRLAGEAIAKRGDLVKRAGDELGHLTGEVDAKADLLGAVDAIEDTAKREAVLAILKSKDAGMAKAFEEIGTSEGDTASGNPKADADARIRAIAKKLQESDPTLSAERAYVKALDTTEGRELHKQLAS
jgi:hypothetical protein